MMKLISALDAAAGVVLVLVAGFFAVNWYNDDGQTPSGMGLLIALVGYAGARLLVEIEIKDNDI